MATCKHGRVSRGPNKGRCRRAAPAKKASKSRKAGGLIIPKRIRPAWAKNDTRDDCKYVAKRGSAKVADKMVRELKKDGYNAYRVKGATVADGYSIFSCGKKR